MGKVKSTKINYATPGVPMDQHEFEKMVKEAENGSFHSLKNAKAELVKWKAKYSKS